MAAAVADKMPARRHRKENKSDLHAASQRFDLRGRSARDGDPEHELTGAETRRLTFYVAVAAAFVVVFFFLINPDVKNLWREERAAL